MGLEELHKPALVLTSPVSVLKLRKLWLLKGMGSRRSPYLIPSNTLRTICALRLSLTRPPIDKRRTERGPLARIVHLARSFSGRLYNRKSSGSRPEQPSPGLTHYTLLTL
jgi:hypothetical protein